MAEFYQAHKELIPTLLQLRKTEEEKKKKNWKGETTSKHMCEASSTLIPRANKGATRTL